MSRNWQTADPGGADRRWQQLLAFLGSDVEPVSHAERLVSGLTALLGLGLVFWVGQLIGQEQGVVLFLPSMAASAVLVFAIPHGVLSQPWPVIGGHVISALIGVACADHIDNLLYAGIAAVTLSIILMHYARCLHPPGGATALTAVVGGAVITDLGYFYVLFPVLFGALGLVITAIALNAFIAWRRYPVGKGDTGEQVDLAMAESSLQAEDLEYALRTLDVYVDLNPREMARIYALASRHAAQHGEVPHEQIHPGASYSNGQYGPDWAVREVLDEQISDDEACDIINYKVVAGHGRRSLGSCTREEMSRWAAYEVFREENSWRIAEK